MKYILIILLLSSCKSQDLDSVKDRALIQHRIDSMMLKEYGKDTNSFKHSLEYKYLQPIREARAGK